MFWNALRFNCADIYVFHWIKMHGWDLHDALRSTQAQINSSAFFHHQILLASQDSHWKMKSTHLESLKLYDSSDHVSVRVPHFFHRHHAHDWRNCHIFSLLIQRQSRMATCVNLRHSANTIWQVDIFLFQDEFKRRSIY